jgi:hypothetical protein
MGINAKGRLGLTPWLWLIAALLYRTPNTREDGSSKETVEHGFAVASPQSGQDDLEKGSARFEMLFDFG